MSRPGRVLIAVVTMLGIVVLAGTAWVRARDSVAGVAVYEAHRGRFVHRVQAEGVLVAEQATMLTAAMGNREPMKIAWLAQDGSEVGAGEVVIRFDSTEMQKELVGGQADQAKAESRVAQASIQQNTEIENLGRDAEIAELALEHARSFHTTDDEIFSRNEIIESEIDQSLATRRREHAEDSRDIRTELGQVELQLLELEKRKAELTIEKAQAGLAELEVRAPHAGIFVLRRDWGEPPTIGQIAWPSMPLAEIPQLDRMKAQVYVLEADAGGLEPGIPADVRLEAHPFFPLGAKVRRVAAVAKRRHRWSPVQYFEVELELALTDPDKMKPGQRVRATLGLQDLEDVIAVPREALFQDQDGQSVVYRHEGGSFEPVAVTLGPAALGRVVIEEGLREGDVIALEDPARSSRQNLETEPAPASGPQGTGPRP